MKLKDRDNITTLTQKYETAIINRDFGTFVLTSDVVYNLIKDFREINEIRELAREYDKDGQAFWGALIDTFEENKIFDVAPDYGLERLTYAITDKCNLFCKHCSYSAKLVNRNYDKIVVDDSIVEKITNLNPKLVILTGGEPLLVDNLKDVAMRIKKECECDLCLATNATLIDEKNIEWLVKLFDFFDISIDGIDADTCDFIRGAGVFHKVMNAIELLKQYGAENISASMVVDEKTQKNEDAFIKLCEDMGITPMVRALSYIGRAKDNFNEENEVLGFFDAGLSTAVGCYDCPGGVGELFLDPLGDIFPCPNFSELKFCLGNIYDIDILSKLRHDKELDWFKNFSEYISKERNECSDCEIKEICWSCPVVVKSYFEKNGKNILRDKCKIKFDSFMEGIFNG